MAGDLLTGSLLPETRAWGLDWLRRSRSLLLQLFGEQCPVGERFGSDYQ